MNDEEVHAAVIDDPDAKPTDEAFWKEARVVRPRRKRPAPCYNSIYEIDNELAFSILSPARILAP